MSRKSFRDNLLILFGLICLAPVFRDQSLMGQVLPEDKAVEWAISWYSEKDQFKSSTTLESIDLKGYNGNENIYLAGFSPGGFVIFSDDENPVILAYSFEDPLPEDPAHPLYTEWLPSYSLQLESIKNSKSANMASGPPDEPGFDEYVEPLLQAQWGQGVPWNKYCPSDDEGRHAPVGCVAVALAQIMHYWEWPVKGQGSNSYIPASHREYGTVEAVFDTTFYQWDQMHSKQPTDASALILFHAGVGTNMNYGPNESGSNSSVYAENAMVNYFLYNPDMIFREKGTFSYNDWAQLLRQDIINGRPVFYRGTDPEGGLGHAFNIDGFRDEYFFHFNWGWNGQGNGYYRLEAMGDGGGNFTNGQAALFGIQPATMPSHDRPFGVKALAGDRFVQLFWDDPLVNNLSHYNIYRDGELIAMTWETRYRDTGLINREKYSYFITAEYLGNTPGESNPTPLEEITPWEEMQLTYMQDFNDSLQGWQIGGTKNSFQWLNGDTLGFQENNSRFIGIRSDSAGAGNKVTDYLISPILDLRQMEGAAIKFDYVFRQAPKVDYFFLMYRRFDNGLWYPVARLDSTESFADWRTYYGYFPDNAKNTLIQLGFFYSDFNGVGKGAGIDNVVIYNVEQKPVPQFGISRDIVCQDDTITVTDLSTGPVEHWSWDFGEGAEPRYSENPGPHTVVYKSGGPKDIHLMVNHLDHELKENALDVSWKTKADFSWEREGLLVTFTNLSENPQYVLWDFGDGSISTELNPVYRFKSKLEFDVEMISYSPPCQSDTMRMHLDLRNGTGIDDLRFDKSIRIYPNPASDHLSIIWENDMYKPVNVELINSAGSVVRKWYNNKSNALSVDINGLSEGIYWIKIQRSDILTYRKIVIRNS
jgi:hypothetical protein